MAGIWICLNVIEILDALNVEDNDEGSILQQYATHPPVEMRKENIKNAIENKDYFDLLDTIDFIFAEFSKYSDRLLEILEAFANKQGIKMKDLNFTSIQEIIYGLVNQK